MDERDFMDWLWSLFAALEARQADRTPAQVADARIPRSPEGYLQPHPQGYVPPGPGAVPVGRFGEAYPSFNAGTKASLDDWSRTWLLYLLAKYYQGDPSTPQGVLNVTDELRHLYKESGGSPQFYGAPELGDEALRHMGFSRTPDGAIVPIPEEAKPPLG